MNTETEDKSLDLIGVGKAMQAIPDTSWERLTKTACRTFEQCFAPISQATSGLGRLIKSKFDRLVDVEKVMAAEAVERAKRKAERVQPNSNTPRPKIFIQVIENTATETDPGIRELWTNLLAQEMVGHAVHPEFGRILARMATEDAQLLDEIASREGTKLSTAFSEAIRIAIATSPFGFVVAESRTFNHALLAQLGLIVRSDGRWKLTEIGRAFIRSVTDPEFTQNDG